MSGTYANRTRCLAAVALLALFASDALAGGMFLPARGIRPLGRGGAFVAGADDPGALWYNPAGLLAPRAAGAGGELLLDLALVDHRVRYARIDSGGNPHDPVTAEGQGIPIPTVAAALDLSPRLAAGVGIVAPYAPLDAYPEDGPQRYSLVSLHGSAMAIGAAGVAWRATDRLVVGGALQNLFLDFRSRVVFSACPGELVCAPEDPEFDALGEIRQTDLFNPSAVVGARLELGPRARLGAAVQLPVWIRSSGTIRVRLPPSGFYEGARVEGERADLRMTLPAMIRVGAELRPARRLRVEAGLDWEMWSQHDEIAILPRGMRIEDAPAVGVYDLGPLRIPRRLRDTVAVRVGVEGAPSARAPVVLRAGWALETSSVSDEWISVQTVDGTRHLLGGGLSWRIPRGRIDAAIGWVAVADRDVPAGTSAVPQLNPIRSGGDPVAVGDGAYRSSFLVGGVGVVLDLCEGPPG